MNETSPRSPIVARAAWGILGALMLALGTVESPGWMPSVVGPLGLGLWAAGVLLLARSARAVRVESTWCDAMRRVDARIAVAALVVLWVVLADLVGVYGSLVALTALGLGGLALAATGGARRLASAVTNMALLGGSLALVAGVFEGILRLPAVAARLGTPAERAQWGEYRYDRLWERNIFGFRSRYETVARSPNSLRIVALGDSYTWGNKIASSDSTWPALLERQLAPELEPLGRTVEVINMGRNSFTTANEAELLRRAGWQFEPDVVILQYLHNDVLPSGPNFRGEPSTYLFPRPSLLPTSLRRGRIRSSALLDLLENQLWMWRNGSPEDRWLALYEDGSIGWEQVKEALHEMGADAAERGVPFYFVLFPDLEPEAWSPEPHRDAAIYQQVIAVAKEACMRIVDLTPIFADEPTDGRSWWATPYDQHPSERAYEVVARTLRDVLLADEIGSSEDPRDLGGCDPTP